MFAFAFALIKYPSICKNGAISGILLCGRVIIPSLFPFTMCILFLMRANAFNVFSSFSPFLKKVLGLNFNEFSVFVFSLVGGYPIGAKLLNEQVINGKISSHRAERMLNFCVNAGPAFTVSAIGSGILGSTKLGVILLISNLIASLLMCQALRIFSPNAKQIKNHNRPVFSVADNFVLSVSDAAVCVLRICYFVILFSVFNSYIDYFAQTIYTLEFISLILEITNAVTKTNNIYLISFLLGFGGISIWCQIISVAEKIKIKYLSFALSRIAHGFLSFIFTFVFVKIFNITVPTFSNGKVFAASISSSKLSVSISIIIMMIIFIITLQGKKYRLKILEDIV